MVLEDLSVIARTLWDFAAHARRQKGADLALSDGVDNLVSSVSLPQVEAALTPALGASPSAQFTPALQAVRRFQDRDILLTSFQPDDIMVLKDYHMTDGPLPLVFLDLAHSSTRDEQESLAREEGYDQPAPRESGDEETSQPWHWRSYDEEYMHELIETQVGWQAWHDWRVMEAKRGLLGLMENTWWKS